MVKKRAEKIGRKVEQVREEPDQPEQYYRYHRTSGPDDDCQRGNPEQPHARREISFLHHRDWPRSISTPPLVRSYRSSWTGGASRSASSAISASRVARTS